nr:hypothetical protein [Comamonas testosteroni]
MQLITRSKLALKTLGGLVAHPGCHSLDWQGGGGQQLQCLFCGLEPIPRSLRRVYSSQFEHFFSQPAAAGRFISDQKPPETPKFRRIHAFLHLTSFFVIDFQRLEFAECLQLPIKAAFWQKLTRCDLNRE